MKSEFMVHDPSVIYQAHRLEMEYGIRSDILSCERRAPARPGLLERIKAFFRRQYEPGTPVSMHLR